MNPVALREEFKSQEISISAAKSFLSFVECSSFPVLYSNLHALIIPCSMRMLTAQDAQVKLIVCESLNTICQKKDFSADPFVKMKIDHLWIDSLLGNFTFKDPTTMRPIFHTVDCLISHCHLMKHSIEYCQLWDKFAKVLFSTCILLESVEQRRIILQIATDLVSRLEVATVLYAKDFLLLVEGCLRMETFDVCFEQFLCTFISYIWAVLGEFLGMLLGILMEFVSLNHESFHECHCESIKRILKLLSDAMQNEQEFISIFQHAAAAFPPPIHALLNAFVCQNSA